MRVDRPSSPRIAIVGTVQGAMDSLTARLQDAGFESVSGLDISRSRVKRTSAPDIAIFLPKTPEVPRNLMAKRLRKAKPKTRIVMLYDHAISGTETADAVINANCGIDDLVRVLTYLTKKLVKDEESRA